MFVEMGRCSVLCPCSRGLLPACRLPCQPEKAPNAAEIPPTGLSGSFSADGTRRRRAGGFCSRASALPCRPPAFQAGGPGEQQNCVLSRAASRRRCRCFASSRCCMQMRPCARVCFRRTPGSACLLPFLLCRVCVCKFLSFFLCVKFACYPPVEVILRCRGAKFKRIAKK